MRIIFYISFGLIFLQASSVQAGPFVHFAFENGSLDGWTSEGEAKLTTYFPHTGKASLELFFAQPGVRSVSRKVDLLPAPDGKTRWLRVELAVRSQGIDFDKLELILRKHFDDGRVEFVERERGVGRFAIVPAGWLWRVIPLQLAVEPNVRAVTLELKVTNSFGAGSAWLDDVSLSFIERGILLQSDRLGNVFPSEQASMTLAVAAPEKIEKSQITLRDEFGSVLNTISLKGDAESIPIPLPTRGYYDITAEATYRDGQVDKQHATAAVVGPLIPEAERMQSRFGLNGCFQELSVAAGARWDRICTDHARLTKKDVSTLPGKIRPAMRTSEKLTIMPVLGTQPLWVADHQAKKEDPHGTVHFYPVTDLQGLSDLLRFVQRVIHQQDFEYFEVINEPDGTWKGTMKELVEFHGQVARAVKALYPETKIVGPGPSSIKIDWIKKLIDLGLLKHIDVLGVHTYVRATEPEGEFIEKVRQLKAYMKSIGRADMPIFVTEYGWTCPPGDWQRPVDQLTRARYLSRSFVLLTAEQIDAIMYFNQYLWLQSIAAGYSILYPNYEPTPGYAAFANTTRFLTGTEGPGKIINLTPTTYLALFTKKGDTVAVVWTTRGTETVFLPTPWTTARDMTGRPLATPKDGMLTASEYPMFVELPGTAMYDLAVTSGISLGQGQSKQLLFQPAWSPSVLQVKEGRLTASLSVPAGTYHLLRKINEGYRATPVNVIAPLEFVSKTLVWPMGAPAPRLEVTLRSHLPKPVQLQSKVKLKEMKDINVPKVMIDPGKTAILAIPLAGLSEGRRYQGRVQICANNRQTKLTLPLDVTLLSCLPSKQKQKNPPIDISAWGSFSGWQNHHAAIPPVNCSATLKMTYDDCGLHILVTVRDDVHQQNQTPAEMWREDSVQFAFDMDAAKPWVANVGGCDGHFKVFEYGLALGKSGPMNWRWISYDKELPANQSEKGLMASVQRKGDKTIYKILFPWKILGHSSKPPAGTTIGFSMVVNDYDGENIPRNGLRLFGGIVETKDATAFGTLHLR